MRSATLGSGSGSGSGCGSSSSSASSAEDGVEVWFEIEVGAETGRLCDEARDVPSSGRGVWTPRDADEFVGGLGGCAGEFAERGGAADTSAAGGWAAVASRSRAAFSAARCETCSSGWT